MHPGSLRPDQEHEAILARGVREWNAWRLQHSGVLPSLAGISLRGRRLRNVDFREANLEHADLRNVDLTGADLTSAYLPGANLNGANLSGVHLTGARFWETCVINVDLTGAVGLTESVHHGPSPLDHRTIWRSRQVPDAFLRGCGVPVSLIDCYRSTLDRAPIEFDSCFICHSHCDLDFVARLHDDLEERGVNAWFAPNDSAFGRRIHEELFEAISGHDKFLVVLSDESMKSRYVGSELRKAAAIEAAEKRELLFPVRITSETSIKNWELFDADLGMDIAAEVRSRSMADFEHWRDDVQYQRELDRLLANLLRNAGTV